MVGIETTMMCRIDLKRQAGCACPTKDIQDCTCDGTGIAIVQRTWDQVIFQLWGLGFGVATFLTGMPALISGIQYIPCVNTSCYKFCAGLFSVVFLILGTSFLGIGIIITESSKWNRNFGIADCDNSDPTRDRTDMYAYYNSVDDGNDYGYAPTSNDSGEEVELWSCSSAPGYCTWLETVGIGLAARL